jgi:eukaryotic-like serine/threonine-protein kinase
MPELTKPAADTAAAGRDERLAEILGGLTEQLRKGEPPDVEAVAAGHGELAAEIRALWAAALLAEDLARLSADLPPTVNLPAAAAAAEAADAGPLSLPRSFGDYELLEELGRGAMGVVYKARQKSLDRLVAVKMLLRGDLASGTDLARFRAEAEAAARLEHAHLVPVFEVGTCDGQAYFSMKYVEGTTLARLLAAGPLPPREAARHLAAICRAVHHAHAHGILHRDLKPSNILIARDGQAHVSDFGLAKRLPSPGEEPGRGLTQSGAILGTPSYMAPEQAAGSRGALGPASDVYSLGAILYEMLTGRPPFQAATHLDTLMLVLEQDPVPPRLLNRQVNRELEMICLKCLQKTPRLRYESAAKLADDLEAFLQGEPISARSNNLAYTVSRLLSETHHATVLENWGLLWMWHSLVLIVLCSATNWLYLRGVQEVGYYLALWGVGLGTWATIFWMLRLRRGPVTLVERQIVHVWAASTIGSMSLFLIERLLGLGVLTLSPVLALMAGMVFLVKAGMLSGFFYIAAAACFVTAGLMALFPQVGLFLFGLVSAAFFFWPGLKYYRQNVRGESR